MPDQSTPLVITTGPHSRETLDEIAAWTRANRVMDALRDHDLTVYEGRIEYTALAAERDEHGGYPTVAASASVIEPMSDQLRRTIIHEQTRGPVSADRISTYTISVELYGRPGQLDTILDDVTKRLPRPLWQYELVSVTEEHAGLDTETTTRTFEVIPSELRANPDAAPDDADTAVPQAS